MLRLMVRVLCLGLALYGVAPPEAQARRHRFRPARPEKAEAAEKAETIEKTQTTEKASDKAGAAKPVLLGTFGEWGAYRTRNGRSKVCYAFAKPKERRPSGLSREPSYVLVSTRPNDRVREEVSVIMGFSLKEGPVDEGADVNGRKFDLVAKGQNAWVKTSAEETKMVDIMRRGSKLVITATGARGKSATDLYLLDGISQALEKVAQECL